MGKLRLRLQEMMPHVWYRRLKMEIGINRANYKRWSSHRKLRASKKLLKASPLTKTPSISEEKDSRTQERESLTHTKIHEREALLHATKQGAQAEQATSSHTQRKALLKEGRETQERRSEKEAHVQKERETHKPSSPPMPNKLLFSPLSSSGACPLHEERETHVGASSTMHMQQAPSLSSPYPLTEKGFHLNMQELEARLKALNTQERRIYYSSPMFTGAAATPVFDSSGLQGMRSDSSMYSPFEVKIEVKSTARKLFCDEFLKPCNEGSKGSYGSTSFTGPSIASSEDTGFERTSSSFWESRDRSSLTSEGSELFPAIDEFENTLISLRRRARRVRRDNPGKQKRRQKCPCKAHGELLESSSLKGKLKISMELRPQVEEASKSMQEQNECAFGTHVLGGDDYFAERSFSREYKQPFSPCYYADCDKLSPIQGSDSVLSESESCRSYPRKAHLQRSSSGSKRFSEKAMMGAGPLPCNDGYRDASQHIATPFNVESCLATSKSACRSSHSSVCGSDKHSLLSKKVNLEANTFEALLPRRCEVGSDFADANADHCPPFYSACTRRASNASPSDCCLKSPSTWRMPDDIPCHIQTRLQVPSKRSIEADYCNDESVHGYNERVESLSKSNSRRERDGIECFNAASLSKGPNILRTFNVNLDKNSHSELPLLATSACRRSINGDSMLARAKGYNYRERDGYECAPMSKRELHDDECSSVASMHTEEMDGNECKSVASIYKRKTDGIEHIGPVSVSKKSIDCNERRSITSMPMSYTNGSKCVGIRDQSRSNACNSLASESSKRPEGDESQSNECNIIGTLSKIHSLKGCKNIEAMGKKGGGGHVCNSEEPSHKRGTGRYGCVTVEPTCQKCMEGCGCNGVDSMCKGGLEGYGCIRVGEEYGCNSVELISNRGGEGYESNVSVASMSKSSSKREGEGGKESKRDGVSGVKKGIGPKEGAHAQHNWYKGGLRVVKESERKEKSKVYESFAMVKCSENPSQDFKESMMDMIMHKKLHESMDLVELLHCFLSLNSPRYHDTIVKAFIDLWSHYYHPSPS